MSTKINTRSPYYLKYDEPDVPEVELTCSLINLRDFSIDQYGTVTLPTTDYGYITSYTSSAGDFTDGKFGTVTSDTLRFVTFTIAIPQGFTNAGDDTIDCSASFIQPTYVCTGGVTTNGSIPNQSIYSDGDSVTIDLTSYFTAGTDPIASYGITNLYLGNVTHSLDGTDLILVGAQKGGVATIYVTATDNDPLTCDATQSIQVTVTVQATYTCTDAFLSGGGIAQDGTITNPSVNGTITAIKETSGGASITSYDANDTGSSRDVTLYFDITVPANYSNSGATVECSKTFSQVSSTLPAFTCEVAGLTGQAITSTGTIVIGTANKGTISGTDPIKFGTTVEQDTNRDVDFFITPPASGYSNSGGDDITCTVSLVQPHFTSTCGTESFYRTYEGVPFMTIAQANAAGYTTSFAHAQLTTEGRYADPYTNPLIALAQGQIFLNDSTIQNNINKPACGRSGSSYVDSYQRNTINPSGGTYYRVVRYQERAMPNLSDLVSSNFLKIEANGYISEIWLVQWSPFTITRIDNIT